MTEADLYTLYKGVYLPALVHTPESLKYYEDFKFRSDDILIVTYPKSGTTWMQEVLPLVVSGGDPASVESLPNWDRVPWLEETRALTLSLEDHPSPRLMTTHFTPSMMPTSFHQAKPKVVYVMRNPKDVFTSFITVGLPRSWSLRALGQSSYKSSWREKSCLDPGSIT